jgi:hypothetical protein
VKIKTLIFAVLLGVTDTFAIVVAPPPVPSIVINGENTTFQNIENNFSENNFPETPNIGDENGSVVNPPNTPNIGDENGSIVNPPETPNVGDENGSVVNPPNTPNIGDENGSIVNPPNTPNIGDENGSIVNPPNTPNVGDENGSVVNPPETPNVGDENGSVINPPNTPNIGDENGSVVNPPNTPNIGDENQTIIVTPTIPDISESPFNYVLGNIEFEKSLDENYSLKVIFVDIGGVETEAIVEKNGFWAMKLPLIDENSSKKYFIKIRSDERGVVTDFFVEPNSKNIFLANRVTYSFVPLYGKYLPDIEILEVTSSTENLGNFTIVDIENSLSTIRGNILSETDLDFYFEAINIENGNSTLFKKANLLLGDFGFKILKDKTYVLTLNLLENGSLSKSYVVNYRDDNDTKFDFFSPSELDFNSSGIPQFQKYLEPRDDLNISLNLIDYLNSIYKISGSLSPDNNDSFKLYFLGEDGKFLDEVSSKDLTFENGKYSFSTIIGRDMTNSEIYIYLQKDSDKSIYIYNSKTLSFQVGNESDFIEMINGFVPNPNIFQPLKILTTTTNLNLSLYNVSQYKLSGKVIFPDSLNLGNVCKNGDTFLFGESCNSITEKIGINSISLKLFDNLTETSSEIDIFENNFSIIFSSSKILSPTLNLVEYSTFSGETSYKSYSLEKLGSSKLLPTADINLTSIFLNDANSSISLDFDLTTLLSKRASIRGNVTKDLNITNLKISVLDIDDNRTIFGSSSLQNRDKFDIKLNLFLDTVKQSQNLLFLISLFDGEENRLFVSNGTKLTTYSNWLNGFELISPITLNYLEKDREINLNLSSLMNDFKNRESEIGGNLILNDEVLEDVQNRVILEVFSKSSGQIIDRFEPNLGNEQNISFQFKFIERGDFAIFVQTQIYSEDNFEDKLYIFDPIKGELVDSEITPFLFDLNGKFFYPDPSFINYISLSTTNYKSSNYIDIGKIFKGDISISGNFANYSTLKLEKVVAYSLNGTWLGESQISNSGDYLIELPTLKKGDSFVLKIIGDGDSYYLSGNNILQSAKSVIFKDGKYTFNSLFTPFTAQTEMVKNGDLAELFSSSESLIWRVSGNVELLESDDIFNLYLINLSTNSKISKFFRDVDNYSIDLKDGGNFAILIEFMGEKLFYNPTIKNFIDGSSYELDGTISPDGNITGFITLNTSKRKEIVDLNFSKLIDRNIEIFGKISLPESLTFGEIINSDGNKIVRRGEIYILDLSTGDRYFIAEIDKNGEAVSNGSENKISNSIISKLGEISKAIFEISIFEDETASTKIYYNNETGKVINGDFIKDPLSQIGDGFYLDGSILDLNINLTDFENSQNSLEINLNSFQFPLSDSENFAELSIYNFESGELLKNIVFENLETLKIPFGNQNYKLVFELNLFQNSKNIETLYFDFINFDKNQTVSTKPLSKTKFIRVGENSIPKVSPLYFDRNISINLNLDLDLETFEVSGTLNSDFLKNGSSLILRDYSRDLTYYSLLSNGKFSFFNIESGDYYLNVLGEDENRTLYSLYLNSQFGFNQKRDIVWISDRNQNGKIYKYPEDMKLLSISENMTTLNLNINKIDLTNSEVGNLKIFLNSQKIENGELFSPNYGISVFKETNETNLSFEKISLKDNVEYFLNLQIENKSYFYDNLSKKLVLDANWSGYENGVKVCPKDGGNYIDCNWNSSFSWLWKPDVSPILKDSFVDGKLELNISAPQLSLFSGNIAFGSQFANREFKISFTFDENYLEYSLNSNENGDLNISKSVPPKNYRVSIFNDEVYLTLWKDENDFQLINYNESFDKFIDLDLTFSLNFGKIDFQSGNKVSFEFQNRENEETIFIKIFNSERSFESETSENSLSLNIPDGVYKIVLYPTKHEAGYSTEREENSLLKFEWETSSALLFDINSDINFSVPLLDNSSFRAIYGKVNIGDGDIENGWIEASRENEIRGVEVENSGKFRIDGLTPSIDYNYSLLYTSWIFNDLTIYQNSGIWVAGDLEVNLDKTSSHYKISGEISHDENISVEFKPFLIEYISDENWKIAKRGKIIENNGSFVFDNIQKRVDVRYFVAVGIRKEGSKGVSYSKFNATDGDINLSIFDLNNSISNSFLIEEVFN